MVTFMMLKRLSFSGSLKRNQKISFSLGPYCWKTIQFTNSLGLKDSQHQMAGWKDLIMKQHQIHQNAQRKGCLGLYWWKGLDKNVLPREILGYVARDIFNANELGRIYCTLRSGTLVFEGENLPDAKFL